MSQLDSGAHRLVAEEHVNVNRVDGDVTRDAGLVDPLYVTPAYAGSVGVGRPLTVPVRPD